jgi:hypothetical protein
MRLAQSHAAEGQPDPQTASGNAFAEGEGEASRPGVVSEQLLTEQLRQLARALMSTVLVS